MEKKIIECVPNFSNGRDQSVINDITNQIKLIEGVKLLSVEPGEATNRTVVTFVGEPEKVIEIKYCFWKWREDNTFWCNMLGNIYIPYTSNIKIHRRKRSCLKILSDRFAYRCWDILNW